MDNEPQNDLETFIHAELQRLPEMEAPAVLHRRVLAAIAEEQADAVRAWWRRAWWNWPVPARVVSLLFFLSLGGVVCVLPWTVADVVSQSSDRLGSVWESLQAGMGIAVPVITSLGALGQSMASNPWVLGGVGVAFLTYLFLVGVGTFYVQFAFLHATAAAHHDH